MSDRTGVIKLIVVFQEIADLCAGQRPFRNINVQVEGLIPDERQCVLTCDLKIVLIIEAFFVGGFFLEDK